MQEAASACGFEMLQALGRHLLFDDSDIGTGGASGTRSTAGQASNRTQGVDVVHGFHEIINGWQASIFRFEARAAGEETFGIWVLRVREDFEDWSILDFFAAIHDEHIVG